jgi:hypothetical protein
VGLVLGAILSEPIADASQAFSTWMATQIDFAEAVLASAVGCAVWFGLHILITRIRAE